MAQPVVTPPVPTKWKAIAALVGGLLGAAAPVLAQLAGVVPEPWGLILGGIVGLIAVATGKTVHEVPYKPPNTVLVPDNNTPPPTNPQPPSGGWTNPWR